jgi:heat shock protein HspQ
MTKTLRPSRPRRATTKRPGFRRARFGLGDVVRHRVYPFRGIIFDVDPVFNSTEEWWTSIPEEIRPRKDQPFYHLLAENEQTEYIAYVSEQNLLPDESGAPLRHPQVAELFKEENGAFRAIFLQEH